MGSKVKIHFSNLTKNLLTTFRNVAKEIDINRIVIVGGVIRDGLLAKQSAENLQPPKDLDLVVEGSAIELAKTIERELGLERVCISRDNKSFKTVEMIVDGISIDLATARKEKYSSPAANPKIISTSIEEDLKRRDFTINAIALDLNTYELIDLHGGLDSLKKHQLDFIHPNSVTEDPTRVIRGARYAARLNFSLSKRSIQQVQSSIKEWPWEWKPGDEEHLAPPALATRLRMELELLLENEPWEQALTYLHQWGGFLLLDESLHDDKGWEKRIKAGLCNGIHPLTAFIAGASDPSSVARRLQLPHKQQNLLKTTGELQKTFTELASSQEYMHWEPSDWCNEIEGRNWDSEAIRLAICLEIPLWQSLLQWLQDWRHIESPISAQVLIEQGWQPGPGLREELNRLRKKRLNSIN